MKKIKLSLFAGLLAFGSVSANAASLLDIYQLALEHDAQLEAEYAGYQAGLEVKYMSRAGLLPQIDGSASYTTSETETTNFINPDASGTFEQNSSSWQVSLNQPLFNMASWYNYKRGAVLSERAEALFGAAQQDLILRVAEAYFNVLRAAANLETALAEEKAFNQQLEQTRQRYEVGLTAITEVHEAQAVYDTANATALQARGNLGIAFEALEVLTGQNHDQVAPLEEDFVVTSPIPAERHAWVEFALQNNYSLKAARLAAEASRQNAKASTAQHLPTLSGSASYNEGAQDGTQYFGQPVPQDSESEGYSFGLSLNVPLFSGGRVSSQRRQAHAESLQARSQMQFTQRNIVQTTRALHLSVDIGVSQIQARKQAIISSESALEATQAGYEVGTRNLVEVLLAQRALYQARRDYDNALYDYIIDTFELSQVAGMLTPVDIERINEVLQVNDPISRGQL